MASLSAVVMVTLSLPDPPRMVWVSATLSVLENLPRLSVSDPAPRSTLALFAAAPSVTLLLPVPPWIV